MKIRTDPRTGIKYIDYRVGGTRRRISLGTKNEQIAIVKAAKIADNKQSRDSGKIPFEEFYQRYLANAATNMRKSTITNIEMMHKRVSLFGSPKYLQDFTAEYIDNFKTFLLNRNLAKTSINMTLSYLKAMLSQADKWDISTIPIRKIKALKVDTERVEFHTNEELLEIISAAPSFTWAVLVHFLARTGLRKSEILRLKWADITFYDKGADVYVSGLAKGHRFRIVPIRDRELIAKLKELHAKAGNNELVFKEVASSNISNNYTKWSEKLGFNCYLHKLRHTFASHLAQKDVPLQKIQKLLGHANIQTTMKYAHLLPSDLPSSVELLGTLGGKKGNI